MCVCVCVCVRVCACMRVCICVHFLSLFSWHAERGGVAGGSAEQRKRTLLTLCQEPEETAGWTWGAFSDNHMTSDNEG